MGIISLLVAPSPKIPGNLSQRLHVDVKKHEALRWDLEGHHKSTAMAIIPLVYIACCQSSIGSSSYHAKMVTEEFAQSRNKEFKISEGINSLEQIVCRKKKCAVPFPALGGGASCIFNR